MTRKSTGGIIITILGILGIGYAAFRIYRAKKSFRKPVVDLSKVGKIDYRTSDNSVSLFFDVSVENPNDIKITVNAVDLTVYDSKGRRLASVRNDKINTSIKPKSTTKIKDIKCKIGAFEVFSFLLSKETSKTEYKVIGEVKVEDIIIPINETISV